MWYTHGVWEVRYLEEAAQERVALDRATMKLEAYGPQLPFPHQSDVRGGGGFRELRLRARQSAWRALYQRVGDIFVIAAVGPEAQARPHEFQRMVKFAVQRMEQLSNEGE